MIKVTTMKMLLKTILGIVFIGFSLISSGQTGKNHSIGLQFNPYLDESLFKGNAIKPVYALRYTFSIKDHITLGPELSGSFMRGPITGPVFKSSNFNLGGFFRYSFLPESRVKPFFELSTYYTFFSYKQLRSTWTSGSDSYLSGYLAPGISLFSKSRKFSVDLFYKFSNKDFVNGKQSVLSYRLNFRF
jgi:hypothetical protein